MQNFSELKIHALQLQLLPAQPEDNFSATKFTSIELAKKLVTKHTQIPPALHEVYTDLSDQCFKQLRIRDTLTPRNDKAIAVLEANKDNNKFIRQVLVPNIPITFGFHDLEKKAAASLTDKLQALRIECQSKCQELVLETRKEFKRTLEDYDTLEECKKLAVDAWMLLCGGPGQTNFYDRNFIITHVIDSSDEQMDGGASSQIQVKVPLSNCIFSIAFHVAFQKHATEKASAAANLAKAKKLQQEALERKNAAVLAAADRPSAESETTIRETLKKEITAALLKEIKLGKLGNLSAVRTSQNVQRGGSANQSTKRGGAAVAGQQLRNEGQQLRGGGQQPRGRGRGRGRGNQGTHPQTQAAHQNQQKSDSQRQRGRSNSRERSYSPRRKSPDSRASSSHNRQQSPASVSNRGRGRGRGKQRENQSPVRGRGRGYRGRGRGRGSPRPPQ